MDNLSINLDKYYPITLLARHKAVPIDIGGKTVSMTTRRLKDYCMRGYIPSIIMVMDITGEERLAILGRDLIQYYRFYELGIVPIQVKKKEKRNLKR